MKAFIKAISYNLPEKILDNEQIVKEFPEWTVEKINNKIGIKRFDLHVHPYVAAYINKGLVSLKRRWQMKYGFGVNVISSQKLAFLQYEFYDKKGEFIDMQEEMENS